MHADARGPSRHNITASVPASRSIIISPAFLLNRCRAVRQHALIFRLRYARYGVSVVVEVVWFEEDSARQCSTTFGALPQ